MGSEIAYLFAPRRDVRMGSVAACRRLAPPSSSRQGQKSADSVEKLRFNEWTSKFPITTAVTIRFCTNLHARANRKRLPRPIFHASGALKFSKRVFQQNRPEVDIRSALLSRSPCASCRQKSVQIVHLRCECLVDYLEPPRGHSSRTACDTRMASSTIVGAGNPNKR